MNLGELFEVKNLVVGFEPLDKWNAIEALIQHLVDTGSILESLADDALDAVQRRERSMSTGMEKGVAIPHAALPELDQVVAILGVVSGNEGVPFESMDGAPAQLIVVLLIPKAKKLLHIRTLADVAKILGNEQVRQEVLEAQDAQTVHRLLAAASA